LALTGVADLGRKRLVTIDDLPPTDVTHFHQRANHSYREDETDPAELADLFRRMDRKLAA